MFTYKIMNPRVVALTAAALCVVLVCGEQTSIAGIQGTGRVQRVFAVGRITAFGSIFVNGVEYSVAGAQIRIDDQPSTESQLEVGQIVTLTGDVDTAVAAGVANEVSHTGTVVGPITSVNRSNQTFTVLGQTVHTDLDTVFGASLVPLGIDGLDAGVVVEVSAFEQASGELLASRVGLKSGVTTARVKGHVKGLNKSSRTFRINSLIVDYGNATLDASLKNGDSVLAEGATPATGAPLQATRVQLPVSQGAANVLGEVEGLVTQYATSAEFWVGDQRITTNAKTHFTLRGQPLGPNLAVTVEGTFDAFGTLVASKVDARKQSQNVARGLVESVSAADGTMTVVGVEFAVAGSTAFDDRTSQHLRPFGLRDVRPGDFVEVHALADSDGKSYATSAVTRTRPDQSSLVRGVAVQAADESLTVLGVRIMASPGTQIAGSAGAAKRSLANLNGLANRVVEVRGNFSGGSLVAERIRVQPH